MDVFHHIQQCPVPGSVILVLSRASDEADLGCKSKYLLPSAESMIQPSLSHRYSNSAFKSFLILERSYTTGIYTVVFKH